MVNWRNLGLFVGVPALAGAILAYSVGDRVYDFFINPQNHIPQNHIEVVQGLDLNNNSTKDKRVRFVYPDGSTTYTLDDVLNSTDDFLTVEVDDSSGDYKIVPASVKDKENFNVGFEDAFTSALYDISAKLDLGELVVRFTSNPINNVKNGLVVYDPRLDIDVLSLKLDSADKFTDLRSIDYRDSHGGNLVFEREEDEESKLSEKLTGSNGAWTLFVAKLQTKAQKVDSDRQAKIDAILKEYEPRDRRN